jgi:hypothetical protein
MRVVIDYPHLEAMKASQPARSVPYYETVYSDRLLQDFKGPQKCVKNENYLI